MAFMEQMKATIKRRSGRAAKPKGWEIASRYSTLDQMEEGMKLVLSFMNDEMNKGVLAVERMSE